MGAVNEWPDNGRSVQAGTPTQDFLAYATKKKLLHSSGCTIKNETLVCSDPPQKQGACWVISQSGPSTGVQEAAGQQRSGGLFFCVTAS